mmetsp:Transcript_24875/g.44773  ORF Transcript_24875/g.44773 Transcript_24875/m.44773 type:complete len:444 (-) Transcript_24875:24-1355(-)
MSTTADHKSELSTKNPTSTKQAKKGNKRKRIKQSSEEIHAIESTDRYNKLHHACSKHLHREAKIVKSFECQKIVRSIKASNDSLSAQAQQDNENEVDGEEKKETKNSAKALKRVQTLQNKLDRTKKMDLDVLVQVGLKRLGVLNLDPRVPEENTNDDGTAESTSPDKSQPQASDTKVPSQSEDQFYQTLLESMLQHKRLSAALDQLNEKVTEYRQWMMHREAMLRGEGNPEDHPAGSKKRKNKKQQQGKSTTGNDTMVVAGGFNSKKRGLDLGGHEGASGLFIGSLSGTMATEGYDEGGENMDGNDDGDHYGYQEEKKKNRPGQRARKAKAMAIEARKSGKTWDSSSNWREKKNDPNENKHDKGQRSTKTEGGEGRDNSKSKANIGKPSNESGGGVKPKEAQHIAAMGKTWKEEGNAHPSWAAAAAKKSEGIAKFAGTKITFD